jgi:hypothetical protein
MRLVVALALLAALVRAELLPSFYVDGLTWRASHIVVVRANGEGGKVEAIESLFGDFAPGETVPVEGLAKYNGQTTRSFGDGPEVKVTGARVLLFLRRSGRTWAPAAEDGGLHVSAAWIEDGRAYGNVQLCNPGPAVMTSLGKTEKELRDRIASLLEARARLDRIAKERDAEQRARRAAAYIGSEHWPARRRALEILEGCGAAAARTLRGILADPLRQENHEHVIQVMGKVGGPGVGEDLTALLERKLAFWKRTAKAMEGPQVVAPTEELHREMRIADATLRALARLRYAPCRETVAKCRDIWRSQPRLPRWARLARSADAILSSLGAK